MQMETRKTEMARNQARANALEVIIGKNDFEVPSSMVDQSQAMLSHAGVGRAGWVEQRIAALEIRAVPDAQAVSQAMDLAMSRGG